MCFRNFRKKDEVETSSGNVIKKKMTERWVQLLQRSCDLCTEGFYLFQKAETTREQREVINNHPKWFKKKAAVGCKSEVWKQASVVCLSLSGIFLTPSFNAHLNILFFL